MTPWQIWGGGKNPVLLSSQEKDCLNPKGSPASGPLTVSEVQDGTPEPGKHGIILLCALPYPCNLQHKFCQQQRGLVTCWLAPGSSPALFPATCNIPRQADGPTYGPQGFLTGTALTHTEETLSKILQGKSHRPSFSRRRAYWPTKGCTSTVSLLTPCARHGTALAALACRASRRKKKMRRHRAEAMALCAHTMPLKLLSQKCEFIPGVQWPISCTDSIYCFITNLCNWATQSLYCPAEVRRRMEKSKNLRVRIKAV